MKLGPVYDAALALRLRRRTWALKRLIRAKGKGRILLVENQLRAWAVFRLYRWRVWRYAPEAFWADVGYWIELAKGHADYPLCGAEAVGCGGQRFAWSQHRMMDERISNLRRIIG